MKLTIPSPRSSPLLRKLLGLGLRTSQRERGQLLRRRRRSLCLGLGDELHHRLQAKRHREHPRDWLRLAAGLAFDLAKNLYVADKGSGSVFKITQAGTKPVFLTGLAVEAQEVVHR